VPPDLSRQIRPQAVIPAQAQKRTPPASDGVKLGGAAGLLPPPGKAGLRGLFFELVVRMFWMIRRKDGFHLKLLAIVNKEADFEFITAMVTARQTEAVKAHVFAASGF
jgi:hypothetical protein